MNYLVNVKKNFNYHYCKYLSNDRNNGLSSMWHKNQRLVVKLGKKKKKSGGVYYLLLYHSVVIDAEVWSDYDTTEFSKVLF